MDLFLTCCFAQEDDTELFMNRAADTCSRSVLQLLELMASFDFKPIDILSTNKTTKESDPPWFSS